MTLSISDLISSATPADFEAKIKSIASTLKLPTTAWQTGGVTNTIIKIVSQILGNMAGTKLSPQLASSGVDGLIATFAAAGFLNFASAVTPDPGVPLADGTYPASGNGFLDIHADSRYNVQRPGPTQATGPVVLTNTTGSTYGPFATGTYHLVNTSTKQTYSNTAPLTIGASGDTTGTFAADVAGVAGTTVANALTPVTSLLGVTVKLAPANTNQLLGTNAMKNADLVAACLAKLQSLGPKLGPGGAYKAFSTPPLYASSGGAMLSGGDITRVAVITNIFNGNVNVYLANANGCSVGALPAGDVTAVNTLLQSVVVPDGVTAIVQRAVEVDVAVSLDVYVPTASVSVATSAVQTAIKSYINSLPIGGAPGAGALKGVPLDALIAYVFENVSYVQNMENATLNGSASDVVLSASQCAMAVPDPVVTVHGTG